jgi:transposase
VGCCKLLALCACCATPFKQWSKRNLKQQPPVDPICVLHYLRRRAPSELERPVAAPVQQRTNGPTEAINGRLEALRRNALGFGNLTHYRWRSPLHSGALQSLVNAL